MGVAPGAKLPEGVFMTLKGREPNDPRIPGITTHPWSALSLS
jgi:hypothetical protein